MPVAHPAQRSCTSRRGQRRSGIGRHRVETKTMFGGYKMKGQSLVT